MGLTEALLREFDGQMTNARRALERVPEDKCTWKPHEKSINESTSDGNSLGTPRPAFNLVFTGPRVQPPPNERPAAKDTVKAFPGEVTRIIAEFNFPTGTRVRRGETFRYVFHCHILEHEDNDMMRPYDVVGE